MLSQAVITDPLENILEEGAFDAYWKEYREVCQRMGPKKVKYHTLKLGKQDYTFTSEYRFWVWNRPADGYQVFVSDKKGLCFEVKIGSTAQEAIQAWRAYLKALNFQPLPK